MLEAVRAGTPLTAKEKAIHDKGLVSILQQIHDELDAAVLEAYGWSDLSRRVGILPTSGEKECGRDTRSPCEELLTRLVALNHERATEEKRGLIRYLRPDYQNPAKFSDAPLQGDLAGTETPKLPKAGTPAAALPWPDTIFAQFAAIQKLLPIHGSDVEIIAACFGKKSAKRSQQVAEILETLQALGKAVSSKSRISSLVTTPPRKNEL